MSLHPDFLEFLAKNSIDIKEYQLDKKLCRFVRFKSKVDRENKVAWFPLDFYEMDGNVKISQMEEYKNGTMYGMDIASAVACYALDISKDDQILDLCCAPGAKLCLLFDLLGFDGHGTVTGVDIAKHRLYTAKSIIQKYKLDRVRLFLCDGTKFSVYPPNRVGPHIFRRSEILDTAQPHQTPFHSTKLIRNDLQNTPGLYDKVLCDVECTHDGSIAHIEKYIQKDWSGFRKEFLDPARLAGLQDLQRGILENGFKLLKPGGILIYSTCSFSAGQNEDVIIWFMNKYGNEAVVESIPSAEAFPVVPMTERYLDNDYLKHTLRFSPRHSQTSGLFIARIRKLLNNSLY